MNLYFNSSVSRFQIPVHRSNILIRPPPIIVSFIGERVELPCTLAPYVNSSTSIDDFQYQWTANFNEDESFMKNLIYTAADDTCK